MDDDQLAHTHLQECAGGMPHGDGVQPSVQLADSEPGRFSSLDLVQNAKVNLLQGRRDNPGIAIAVFADNIHAGLQARFPCRRQQRGRPRAKVLVRRIQRVEQ